MEVRELCPPYVVSCHPDTSLSAASALLAEHGCGILPVVDASFAVRGVVTDRDICLAVGDPERPPQAVLVRDIMSAPVHAVSLGDPVSQALYLMRTHRVRRLPVTDAKGVLEGILSIDDLVLAAGTGPGPEPHGPSVQEVMTVLKSLCARAPRAETHHGDLATRT